MKASWIPHLALFALSLFVYRLAETPAWANRLDNHWYVPTSLSLLAEGNAELSEYRGIEGFRRSYRIKRIKDLDYNYFPIGTSLVTLPVVALGALIYAETPQPEKASRIADLSADVMAALAVVVFFLIARLLGSGLGICLASSLVFAWASPQLSIHGGGLWSHNTSSFLFLVSVWLVLRQDGRAAWTSGVSAGLAIISRPTSVLWVGLLGVFLWCRDRRHAFGFTVLVAFAGALFTAWSVSAFGALRAPYFRQSSLSFEHFWEALAGHLVSPNRGLFVFCPILLLAPLGGYLALRRRGQDRRYVLLHALLVAYCLLQWAFLSTFEKWWGGGSFGPRLLAEAIPAWCLLLVPVFEALKGLRGIRKWSAACGLTILLSASLFVQYRGATDPAVYGWNSKPRRVDRFPSRIWDWQDLQILRR